jgi:hypothetical protein
MHACNERNGIRNLEERIFPAVLKRIQERKDSLVNMGNFQARGLKGWFKVEIVVALENTSHPVEDVKNQGTDLLSEGGIHIELKGQTRASKRINIFTM